MPQFDVSSFSSQLFWLVVTFGFLYFIVSKFIAPKAEDILTSRNRVLQDNLQLAEQYQNDAESLETARKVSLDEVNEHVEEIQKHATESLESAFLLQKQELSLELKKKEEKSSVEIAEIIERFNADVPKSSIDLAAFIIEKVTKKPADMKILKVIEQKVK